MYKLLHIVCMSVDYGPFEGAAFWNKMVEVKEKFCKHFDHTPDLFQCFINIPPTIEPGTQICPATGGKFDRAVFLFKHFVVTAGGKLRARQRILDNSIKIQSIGITLMDGADGDFEFDLSRIRAVNYDETGVIGEAD